ncbi:alkaline phosphatase family protein [Halobaculum gomorrense]|uniref:hypothetical protein n=1 Tax=Halobaculum gomorrense TaxID=43928 RepID=UPI001160E377|nr:hypothetical protein [Halobaculum gomorrense]
MESAYLNTTVLDAVEVLLDNVKGKVAVTADHGNAVGEWGVYGHPAYVPVPAVKRVPWAVTSADGHGSYTVDQEYRNETADADRDEFLEALGYK